jgi:cytochrome d ubiquinol oxidase subunit II
VDLVTVWFALVVLCWVLFFVLEGFDFGVGLLAVLLGRDDHERAAAIRTVGPFWDGNEVWLVAAIGITYATFPDWYAALLSGLYLPMVLLLLLLAGRGVALEFRGKYDDPAARRRCELALAGCSLAIVLLWGAVLSVFVRGLALGSDGEVHESGGTLGGLGRSVQPLLQLSSAAGACLALFAAVLLGATFLGLRTTGPIRQRARLLGVGTATAGAATAGLLTLTATGLGAAGPTLMITGTVAVLSGLIAMACWAGYEAVAFTLTTLAVAAAVVLVLGWNGQVVLPSTLDPAWSLTRSSTAATDGALRLMSLVGVFVLPGILVYQAWSYWVFRQRIASGRVTGEPAVGERVTT